MTSTSAAARPSRLVVLKGKAPAPDGDAGEEIIHFDVLRSWLKTGRYLRRLFSYRSVELRTERVEAMTKPLATAVLLRLLSRGTCIVTDPLGTRREIGGSELTRLAVGLVRDGLGQRSVRSEVAREVAALEAESPHMAPLDAGSGTPLYIRSDISFGLTSGGSIGHIAGVLNSLPALTGKPVFLTTDWIPSVAPAIKQVMVVPVARYWDYTDMPSLVFNRRLYSAATRAASRASISFIYQRYSAYDYSGAKASRSLRVPFVLEYNGPEVWIHRNWGRPLRYERLADRIELLNLRAADLVVVVSEVMLEELVGRGVSADRILVNPNGVDTEVYAPEVDGQLVRDQCSIGDEYVIGFIGTFEKWHGAENLVAAFSMLLDRRPELRGWVRLLMIGDGVGLSAAQAIIRGSGYADRVVFTGRVPQSDGPSYLAACDMLVSPHVPNPDGSRFFGSPTKLFEYMAMGKPIVASGLEQIADVLEDGRTAALVEPGDVGSLVSGMERVIDDGELARRIADGARASAVRNHTWREHTRRIVERLEQVCA